MVHVVFPASAGVILIFFVSFRTFYVFPASAGVILIGDIEDFIIASFPRIRGGDPTAQNQEHQ